MPRHHHRRGEKKKGQEVPVPPERAERTALFGRTKMCKFHILGCCSRGNDCNFAHDCQEMNPLPDLTRTKLCKTLINTGSCEDPDCKYAHNKDELRGSPPPLPKSGASNAREATTLKSEQAHRLAQAGLCPPADKMQGLTEAALKQQLGMESSDNRPALPDSGRGMEQAMQLNAMVQAMQSGILGVQAGMMHWSMAAAAQAQRAAAQSMLDDDYAVGPMLGMDSPQGSQWSNGLQGIDGAGGKGRDNYRQTGPARGATAKGNSAPSPKSAVKGGKQDRAAKLLVKNTFITCEEETTPKPLRAIHSAAGRLNMLSNMDQMSEDGDEPLDVPLARPYDLPLGLPLCPPLPDLNRISQGNVLDTSFPDPDGSSLLTEKPQSTSGLVRTGTWGTSLATLTEETHPKLGDIDEDFWDGSRQVSASTEVPSTERTEKRVQDTPLHAVVEGTDLSRRSQSSLESPRSQGMGSSDEEHDGASDGLTKDDSSTNTAGLARAPLPAMPTLAVKNTFLEFETTPAPTLRSIQTASGRLDQLGRNLEDLG
mmetsp:Transcript_33367/g.76149  ORF Transcript_33367/g.76149 Transcript_33367/m.76149 type:complete len:538 (-) Transcript_33367:162-1775(-)